MFIPKTKSINAYIFAAFILYILCLLSACSDTKQSDLPNSYVYDYLGVLNYEEKSELNSLLSNHDRQTSVQLVIVIPSSLLGKSIENFAIDTFSEWRIGQKGVNNGVLVVIAPKERKARIELGYGIEWPIGDSGADIIMTNMISEISKGSIYKGLLVACQEIIRQTDQIDWKIGYNSIEELEKNKRSCMGKIVSFKVKLIKENSDSIVVAIKNYPNLIIEVTKHMNDIISIIKKEKDKATIFARVIKTDPFVFQLLGVISRKEI